MVTRTPPQNYQRYLDFGKVPKAENSGKELNNNEKEKTDNNTRTNNNMNKEQPAYTPRYIQPNHDAVFGYYPVDGYILPGRTLQAERRGDLNKTQKTVDNVQPSDNKANIETDKKVEGHFGDYGSVRRGVDLAQEKLELVNNKVEALDSGWKHIPRRVGEVETDMAAKGRMVDELEWRNKVHSAKIHDLERELKQVQLENRAIKGRLLGPNDSGFDPRYAPIPEQQDGPYGDQHYSPRYGDRVPQDRDRKYNLFEDQAKERYVRGKDGAPNRLATNDQYNYNHVGKITDEHGNSYYGLNKIYDPDNLTSYRHEHIPYLMHKEEKEKITQYRRDFEPEIEKNRRKEDEYHARMKEMEDRVMREGARFDDFRRPFDNFHPPKEEEKPKTYEYTAPYQSPYPPMDINKYFHHPDDRPRERTVNDDEYNRIKGDMPLDTTYETTYVGYDFRNPYTMGYANPSAGGLFLTRFHGSSYQDVNTALHLLQRQLSHSGARVGLASSPNVMVIHGTNGWRVDKTEPRKQIRIKYDCVHDAILAIWFPSKANANELFRSEHNNRFRDAIFLYPHGYDSTYVPLKEIPKENLDTFLVMEVQNANRYHPDDLMRFEMDSRAEIQRRCPSSQPYFSSVTCRKPDTAIDGIRPGNLFKDGSRIYMSAFDQLTDIDSLWGSGIILDILAGNRIHLGDVQVFAFSMKDTKHHFSTPHWR